MQKEFPQFVKCITKTFETKAMNKNPSIAFVGMTHLGLISSVAAAEKRFNVTAFDSDNSKIKDLAKGNLPISEPKLADLILKNSKLLNFTSDENALACCDVIYVAPDVNTDDDGRSDLNILNNLLNLVFRVAKQEVTIVILSQVPPGFTRQKWDGKRNLYYQVETLIFGQAIDRALFPERFIIGCAEPKDSITKEYKKFLEAYECPILPMRYESAELAKISINMFLVSSVSTTNIIAELCEKIGADWSEIVPSLRLDKRIGSWAYLSPGLGVSGGNLERDLTTFCNFSDDLDVNANVVKAWISDSKYRKNWPLRALKKIEMQGNCILTIGILGLSYKEDTHSTKNSPALQIISQLSDYKLRVYDPQVVWNKRWHNNTIVCHNAEDVIKDIDLLMILTPWKEFYEIDYQASDKNKRLDFIIDPYGVTKSNNRELSDYKSLILGKS